jgi:hypothetical protein
MFTYWVVGSPCTCKCYLQRKQREVSNNISRDGKRLEFQVSVIANCKLHVIWNDIERL